ncbi:MAG: RidA family protein [Flavobacteriaceae bacterium]|jgi:2-iminobutanoate/2-iminopropanoate deaminase|nr:RidA family protein [Candidatus Neomarinimicrobiota bacterium]MBT5396428.1 RidA family protein [Flavobacteriaceae bacterium]MBT5856688.1 RidA family protein [Flavobacteriaceae bacterium]MBT7403880.1 RidA family protein [Flavobacteriaceae bacterium]MBT7554792.1 RidA family protein [Flavobacteriaceae bacterium]
MEKKFINTNKSPAPIGPYNQAILKGNTLFISGQIALDPESMKLNNGSINNETHQVMMNLKNILEEANMSFNDVVKSSIFLSDMSLFKDVNEIYGSYLTIGNEPARETIAVKTLPMNVNVEISMIAVI